MAHVNRATRLRALGRSEEAIAAYDQVVDRFDGTTRPDMSEQVAKALSGRAARSGYARPTGGRAGDLR
jgi:hypothetical protein